MPLQDIPQPTHMGVPRRIMRRVATVLMVALLNTALLPLSRAQQLKSAQAAQAAQMLAAQGPQTLQDLRDEWAQLRTRWQQAGVPQDILARQAQLEATFEQQYRQRSATFSAQSAPGQADPGLTHHPINLNNLPWQVQKATRQDPMADPQALQAKLFGAAAQPLSFTTQKAAAPTAADLAPTLDAPHTPAIKALAQSLGNNPYKIFQWVHDNIYYVPTHGSVQGAQDTLDKKAGNAADTASLLLALLRSAGVSARYVYGTVELPASNAMNWVGGAQTLDAAQQILSQGGVPNVALVSGGQINTLRLEHIWVEAHVRYNPGRGASHVGGQVGDTWVPLDASYKQYTFTPGMDLASAVPLDTQALLAAAEQGAQSNAAEGWVKNLNTSALQTQLTQYQTRLKTHIDSQNAGKSTVGDVLGTRQARIDPLPYLAGTLPYTLKARTQAFSAIPASLQAQFRYNIYPNAQAAAWGDSPLLSYQAPTAALAGKKLTLAWVAASAADQAAIEALIPKPAPGQTLDPSQLPRGLSHSIQLKPQLLLEGQVQAQGPGLGAGTEVVGAGAFTKYGNSGDWDETTDPLIAGQQSALGLSVQGISQEQLTTLKTRMEATKQTLQQAQAAPENQRAALLQGMTGDHLTGDLLTATLWGYFAALQSHGAIASSQAHMFDRPALSYGLFHAQVRSNKLYGIVTTGITFQGLNMDIGHVRHIRWVTNDDPQAPINNKPELTQNGKTAAQNRWIAYNKMRGQYASAMEHAVPEQFWVDKSQCRYVDEAGQIQNPSLADCAQGVSAVKALAIAQAEGQRIYTITAENAATALPNLPVGGSVGDEIRSAVQAGKEVTVHERAINAHGFSGYGYIVTDPDTGGGGYLIEGRGNGGWLEALTYALGVALKVIIILPAIAYATAILSVLTSPFVAAAILLVLSMAALIISAQIYLAEYPCARDIIQGIAGAIMGSLWGMPESAAIVVAFIRALIGGLVLGSYGVVRTCLE
ncbi:hypothetical protein GCM10028785_37160 [Hydrogenophaga soli]